MSKKMLIDTLHPEETRISVINDGRLEHFDFESPERLTTKGNIYLAKIKRVEPSLQAAFVDYGAEKHGFLPFGEIDQSYYRIPISDRPEGDESEDGKLEDQESPTPKSRHRYQIQDVIKHDLIVLVQIIKEVRGSKGAALTTRISLPGRYCVLMPNSERGSGISRKISDSTARKKLRDTFDSLDLPDGMSLIIRTAGQGRTKAEIKRDCEYLQRKWNDIRALTLESQAPIVIHEESALIARSLRDTYDRDVDAIIMTGEDGYKQARTILRQMMPSHVRRIKLQPQTYHELFETHRVEKQIDEALGQVCTLRSGGYLVINHTEAVTTIDVNSGRSTQHRNISDTALDINLEAAEEIPRQLRLRNLAGLIIIDFIDMASRNHNHKVENRLHKELKVDRARIQVEKISSFGLLEMSRQRLGPTLLERCTDLCPHCHGLGRVRLENASALKILRAIDSQARKPDCDRIQAFVPLNAASYLLNDKRAELQRLEIVHNLTLVISADSDLNFDQYRLEAYEGEKVTKVGDVAKPVRPRRRRQRRMDTDTPDKVKSTTDTSGSAPPTKRPSKTSDDQKLTNRKTASKKPKDSGSKAQVKDPAATQDKDIAKDKSIAKDTKAAATKDKSIAKDTKASATQDKSIAKDTKASATQKKRRSTSSRRRTGTAAKPTNASADSNTDQDRSKQPNLKSTAKKHVASKRTDKAPASKSAKRSPSPEDKLIAVKTPQPSTGNDLRRRDWWQ